MDNNVSIKWSLPKMKNVLHIFSQVAHHDEAWIVGDEEALKALHKAIGEALENGSGASLNYVADGEGFNTIVIKTEPMKLDCLKLPYQDKTCLGETEQWKNHPAGLLTHSEYQKLINNV
jgi:hypothetical protein